LWTAIIASFSVIIAAPLVGQLNVWLRDVAPGNYATVLAVVVVCAAILALGSAILTIRDRRLERFAWIAAAAVIAIGYGLAARTGVADVDAAERFHFVEYGLLALLFYKAFRPARDGAVIVMPLLCGVIVGTAEEWLQWFVPARVGEMKDVLLNLVAVSAGVLFAIGLEPPPRVTLTLHRDTRRRVAAVGSLAIATFAGFFHSVHLGHLVADREAGVFHSRYSAEELLEISRSRAETWKTHPPLTWARYSREDQYLTEGVAHVRRRNERWGEGNILAARHENLILERYYAPVLDTPSYVSPDPHRWPDAQRAQAHQQGGPGFMIYESDALDYPVVTWQPLVYWLLVIAAIVLMLRRTL
jgi:hypothetical protein